MQSKYFEELIQNYLNEGDSDYAIMLHGPWGAGKTYYVKNLLRNFIEEHQTLVGKNNKPVSYKTCYLSLKGIKTLNEVRRKVALASFLNDKTANLDQILPGIYGSLKSIVGKLIKSSTGEISSQILDQFNIDLLLNAFTSLPKNYFLIIDDLERLGSGFYPDEVLGYLSDFFEANGTKCLFITNQDKLEWKNKEVKEKYIRYSVALDVEHLKISEIIFEHGINDDLILWKDHIFSRLPTVFSKKDNQNLRTFKYFLTASKVLLKPVSKLSIKKNEDFPQAVKSALDALLIACFESKSIQYHEDKNCLLDFLKATRSIGISWLSFYNIQKYESKREKQELTKSQQFQLDLYQHYIELGKFGPEYDGLIGAFLETGVFTENDVNSYFKSAIDKISSRKGSPFQNLLNHLSNYTAIEDEEFPQLIVALKQEAFSKQYPIQQYLQLVKLLAFFQNTLNLKVGLDDQLLREIIEHASKGALDFNSSISANLDIHPDDHISVKQFVKEIETSVLQVRTNSMQQKIITFWNSMSNESFDSFVELSHDPALFESVVFSNDTIPQMTLIDKFKILSNKNKSGFVEWFRTKYIGVAFSNYLVKPRIEEEGYLTGLKALLNEKVNEEVGFSMLNFKHLIISIDKALEEINNYNQASG